MNDLFVIVAILLANSVLNVVTWLIIIGKTGHEIKSTIRELQNTIRVMKNE